MWLNVETLLFCYALAGCVANALARPGLHASVANKNNHLRRLVKQETPVHTLTWSQFSEWGIEMPELRCTSPGAPRDTVTSAGFNITTGAGYANPPLSCTAEKKWPYGYGYMQFTAVTAASEAVAANFTHDLEANQIWKVSRSTTDTLPTQLYYNMKFEPSWSIFYSVMLDSDDIGFYVMKDVKVAYGPDGWWLGSDKCRTFADTSTGGAISFKCDAYIYMGNSNIDFDPDKKLLLTYGLNANQLNFSIVDAF